MNTSIKTQHGGARPGAGRPKAKRPFPFRIDIDLYEKIKNFENKSQFINDAIRDKLKQENIK